MRGFEQIEKESILPRRGTTGSAGYDFALMNDTTFKANETTLISTGIKASMPKDEFLMIVIRSSMGIKNHLSLKNQVVIVDSDYYQTDKPIMLAIVNNSDSDLELQKGERIAQGIFLSYLKVADDLPLSEERTGGIGSTDYL